MSARPRGAALVARPSLPHMTHRLDEFYNIGQAQIWQNFDPNNVNTVFISHNNIVNTEYILSYNYDWEAFVKTRSSIQVVGIIPIQTPAAPPTFQAPPTFEPMNKIQRDDIPQISQGYTV